MSESTMFTSHFHRCLMEFFSNVGIGWLRNYSYTLCPFIYEYDVFFVQCLDCTRKLRLSSTQKCIIAVWQLAYGTRANSVDEYCKFDQSTTMECLVLCKQW
jgi:hypothetical protein